jgi:hypothetical protein
VRWNCDIRQALAIRPDKWRYCEGQSALDQGKPRKQTNHRIFINLFDCEPAV